MPGGGLFFRKSEVKLACSDLVNKSGSSSGVCPELKACLEDAMNDGSLLQYDSSTGDLGLEYDTTSISVWFFFV